MLAMNDPTTMPHQVNHRVRSVFDEREGVVVESNMRATLIEFEENEDGERFTHRKWLPTRDWAPLPSANPKGGNP